MLKVYSWLFDHGSLLAEFSAKDLNGTCARQVSYPLSISPDSRTGFDNDAVTNLPSEDISSHIYIAGSPEVGQYLRKECLVFLGSKACIFFLLQ